jgi:hypothetical protein
LLALARRGIGKPVELQKMAVMNAQPATMHAGRKLDQSPGGL